MLRTFVQADQYPLLVKVLSTMRHGRSPPPASVIILHGREHTGRSSIVDLMKHMIPGPLQTDWTSEFVDQCKYPKLGIPPEQLDKRFIFLPPIKDNQFGCLDQIHHLANREFERTIVVRDKAPVTYKCKPGVFVCTLTDSALDSRAYTLNAFDKKPKMPMYFHFPNRFHKDQNSEDSRLTRMHRIVGELMQNDVTLCMTGDNTKFNLKTAWD